MSVQQARKEAARLREAIGRGEDPALSARSYREGLTLEQLCSIFLAEYVALKRTPNTLVAYRGSLRTLVKMCGNLKATDLTKDRFARVHRDLHETPVAANQLRAVTSKMFTWASANGYLPEGTASPTRGIAKYREHSRERFLTTAEFARLAEALNDPAIDPFAVAAIRLLILTGARLREILDAQWSFLDIERRCLFLPVSKTGRKPVYLNAAALELLASLPRLEGNPYIFPGAKPGRPRFELTKPWRHVTLAAGLEGLRVHDLRHSFASVGAAGGLGLPIIGKLLGHTHASTTQRYAHLADARAREAVEAIGEAITKAMKSD